MFHRDTFIRIHKQFRFDLLKIKDFQMNLKSPILEAMKSLHAFKSDIFMIIILLI